MLRQAEHLWAATALLLAAGCGDGLLYVADRITRAPARPCVAEGRHGAPACEDGLDNDCDGYTDAADPGCWPWCSADEVCGERPLPFLSIGVPRALWVGAEDDVWIGGSSGDLLHWDGEAWHPYSAGVDFPLERVWGFGARDAWAVGSRGTVLRYDGARWRQVAVGTRLDLFGVWGSSPDAVWVVGASGTILHWDGAGWRRETSYTTKTLFAVWGSAADDVWAAGEDDWDSDGFDGFDLDAVIRHRDAATWVPVASHTVRWLFDGISFGRDHAVSVGMGTIATWNGETWRRTQSPTAFHCRSIWGTAPDDLWVVCPWGFAHHFDGDRWEDDSPGTIGIGGSALLDIMGTAPGRFWAVGYPGILRHEADGWSNVVAGPLGTYQDIWGSAPDDLWVVATGPAGVLRFDGSDWSSEPLEGTERALAIWGAGPDDVWLAGASGSLRHRDAGGWSRVPSPTTETLHDLWGRAADDLWAVGASGTILHWDGAIWADEESGTALQLNAIRGTATGEPWIAGAAGLVLRRGEAGWQRVDAGIATDLHAVWARADDEVWVAGAGGLVANWDGAGWTASQLGATVTLRAIAGSPAIGAGPCQRSRALYASGIGGVLFSRDGESWRQLRTVVSASLNALWVDQAGALIAVGSGGVVLRRPACP